EIARYDAADAAAVSAKVRATANLDLFLTTMTELYEEAIAEQRLAAYDPDGESRAAAAYLRDWGFERRYEWERTRLLRALPRPLVNLIIRLVLRYKDTDWWASRT
ncbi:MAG TPA: hypothetical protein VFP36_15915, partial [Usitatibacter sp.]|nr:hypothetical protein [Usitatibacter sp.]